MLPHGLKHKRTKYASIPFGVLLYMSWRNINSKNLRSSITILGVTIGIGAICFLVSLGLGLQTLVTKQVIGNKSVKTIDVSTQNSRIVKLNKDTVDRVRGLPGVESLGVSYSQAGIINIANSKLDIVIYGIDGPYQEMLNPTIIEGGLFNPEETDKTYINKATLDAIGISDAKQVIGKTVTASIIAQTTDDKGNVKSKKIDKNVSVVGVIDSGAGGEVYLPEKVFQKAGIQQYSQAKLIAKNTGTISGLRKQIESFGLQTASPFDTIEQVNQIFRYFTLILLGFGAIGMIIAILGMFNTLTISLLERTGEIGLLQALGGRRRDMRSLFFIEATILSLIGAVAGILVSTIGGWIVNFIVNRMANSRGITETISLFDTPWWLIIGLIIFMIIIGLLVVVVPARRAERINPVDALRQE